MTTVLFGYRHVSGVPMCPCNDPGNYLSLEQTGDDPLICRFRCWCGRTMPVVFDCEQERADVLALNGVTDA